MMIENKMTAEELENLFKSKGLTVTIWGCGCCDSPEVKVTYEGRVFEEENFCLDMHEEDKTDE